MKSKLDVYRYKAYNEESSWRVFKTLSSAKKFAGLNGSVVDLYADKLA